MNSMTNMAKLPAGGYDRILRVSEVRSVTGLSRATIYRREMAGSFPARVPLGPNSVGWYESEVQGWVANRRTQRA